MSREGSISSELGHESFGCEEVADRLFAERPIPGAGFRAALHAHLHELAQRPAPKRLGLAIAGCFGSGSALLGLVGLGVLGIGPLAG